MSQEGRREKRKKLGRALMQALELDGPAQRAYIDELRAGEPEMADELQAMLAVETMATDFLAGSAVEEIGAPQPSWRDPTVVDAAGSSSDPAVDPAVDPETGEERWIGPYRLLHVLGTGGMGQVFLAEQKEPLERLVALKLIRGTFRDEAAKARFEAERKMLQRLEHPNVGRILDAGTTEDGSPFFALEVISGEPLDRYCDSRGLDLRQRLELMIAVCRGVEHAHRKRIIHRDLKPTNILVCEIDGSAVPKIIDFGIAESLDRPIEAAADSGDKRAYGTPTYMSPEALMGSGDIDTRTDVYSLGVVLYQLLCGCRPFEARSVAELVSKVSSEDPPAPSTRLSSGVDRETAIRIAEERRSTRLELKRMLRGDVRWILLKAIARDAEKRYESVAALADDLEHYLENRPIAARTPSAGYLARKWTWRHRWPVLATVLVVAAGLGLLAQSLFARERTQRLTRAGQELTRQIERVEWRLRVAHLLPRHDLTPELGSIRRGMADLRAKIPDLYAGNRAMAEYALGRAALSLDELQTARTHLEAAWKEGYRRPEAALALGTTLGRLYERRLDAISRVRDRATRQALRREAQEELRDPSLDMLARARADRLISEAISEAIPELLLARMAYYREHYERALEQSRSAAERGSTFFEARFLEAQILERQSLTAEIEKAEALDLLARAEEAALEGLEIGRSSPEGHLRLCRLRGTRVALLTRYSLPGVDEAAASCVAACDAAASVLPPLPEAALEKAAALLNLAEVELWDRHSDPSPIVAKIASALDELEGSVEHRAEAEWTLGFGAFLRSVYFEQQGTDPTGAIDRSIERYRRAIRLGGGTHQAHRDLANALAQRGNYEMNRGADPTADLAEAEKHARAAAELAPEAPEAWGNLAVVHVRRAEYQLEAGEDPSAALDAADDAIARSLALDAERIGALSASTVVSFLRGHWRFKSGGDAAPAFRRAFDTTKRTLELFPDAAYAYLMGGQAWIELARLDVAAGRDPSSAAAKARELYRQGLERVPGLSGPQVELASLALLEASHALSGGHSPVAAAEKAIEHTRRALELDERRSDAVRLRGEAELLLAAWAAPPARYTPEAEVQRAFARSKESLDAAREADPSDVDTHLALARWAWRKAQAGLATNAERAGGLLAAGRARSLDGHSMEALALEGALLSLEIPTRHRGLGQVAEAVRRNPNLPREWHRLAGAFEE